MEEGGRFNMLRDFEVCKRYFNMGHYSSCIENLRRCHLKLIDTFNHKAELICINGDKIQLTVIRWCIQHNIILCESLSGVNDSKVTYKLFYRFLLDIQGIPPTRETLFVEMSVLYSCISSLLLNDEFEELEYSKNEVILFINEALKRFFLIITGSNPSFLRDEINGLLSLVQGILEHVSDLTAEEKRTFLILCCGISWQLLCHGYVKESLHIFDMMSLHADKCNKTYTGVTKMTRFVWSNNSSYSQIPVTNWTDVVRFVHLYCLLIQDSVNHSSCEEYLEKITDIPYFQYLNAVTYFKEGQFCKVIDITRDLRSDSSYTIEGWLKAKICNLIGCCYSLMGKHHISKEWFVQAISEDTDYLLALRNLSVQFRILEKPDNEMKMLQLLVKVATNIEKQQKRLQSNNISHPSLLYLLAKRYFDLNQYKEAAKWFEHLLQLLDEKFIYQFSHCNDNSTIPELQIIYHEAAYSYLNMKKYDRCIEICQKAMDSYCYGSNMTARLQQVEEKTKVTTSNEMKGIKYYINSKETSVLLQHLSSDIIALLMRSAAFYHSGRKDEALSDMKRARIILMPKNSTPLIPDATFADMKSAESKEIGKENTIFDYLMSQILNNLAVFCIEQKFHQEAIRLLRISLSCFPANTDSAYNFAIFMTRLGHKNQASQTWESFKINQKENNSYLSSVSSEQIQKLEHVILTNQEESIQSKLVISDKWIFSKYNYNVELDSCISMRQIYMPLYINLPLPKSDDDSI